MVVRLQTWDAVMPNTHRETDIASVRRFNRFYTRQIGLLQRGYLGDYSLAEARVLQEIALTESVTASSIAGKLGLDAGYLSRILRGFKDRGLITHSRSKADARRSDLALTARGRQAFAPLERRSQRQVETMLARVAGPDRPRLVAAMHDIETLLDGAATASSRPDRDILLRDPMPGDLGWIVSRQAQLYAQDYQWTGPFEGMCAKIVADFGTRCDRTRERCWIAEVDGKWAGSILLVRDTDDVARIRLLFVEPEARGLGVGVRLVEASLAFARAAGYRKVTLWTHRVLTTARDIYRRAGFKLVATEKHKTWGKPVVSETWDLLL
jgi:DNA-binding MarR family transcriptional regulator/GNAT superfamily N-acetyltransferase